MRKLPATILTCLLAVGVRGYARADSDADAVADQSFQLALQGSPSAEFLRAEDFEQGRDGRAPNYSMAYVWLNLAFENLPPMSHFDLLAAGDIGIPLVNADKLHMNADQVKNADDRIQVIIQDRISGSLPDACGSSAHSNGECDFLMPIQP